MMDITAGKYFRGYLASDTLATDAAIPLFDQNGIALTLAKGERPIIYETLIANGATQANYTIYADTNGGGTLDSGEELVKLNLLANTPGTFPNASGFVAGRTSDGAAKNKLRVVASANSVGTALTIVGHIIQS